MEGPLMDYELLITFAADPGEDPVELAERLLDAAADAGLGAVTAAHLADQTFDLSISLDAASIDEAIDKARPRVAESLVRAGLPGRVAARLEARAIPADGLIPA